MNPMWRVLVLCCVLSTGCEWWFGAKKDECEPLPSGSTLVLAGGCFQVDGNLVIGDGQSVQVGEGTQVKFGPDSAIRVQSGGRFTSAGTGSNPVSLGPSDGCWGGMIFEPGSSGALEGTVVDGGGACVCDAPRACVTVSPGAEVTLSKVGASNCGAEGVAGQPAVADQVGCQGVGVCVGDDADCVLGGDGGQWCAADADMCWDQGGDVGERDCEIGERRCADDTLVQSCVGGKWTSITDCAAMTNGQTACRSYDGFPRCGLPGPSECLALPEQPGGTYIPGCTEKGCPEYRAACMGGGEAASCEGQFPVEGCLHPNTLVGPAVFSGLGPRWLSLMVYNWGGLPDTTEGVITARLEAPSPYRLRTWLPPDADRQRNFCGEGLGGVLPMPPPGEQYEVLLEVSTYTGGTPNSGATVQVAAFNTGEPDGEIFIWRRYSPDVFYARCDRVEEARVALAAVSSSDFLSDSICVDAAGRFVNVVSGAVEDGYPDLSLYPDHRDTELEDCDTWDLVLEYVDE